MRDRPQASLIARVDEILREGQRKIKRAGGPGPLTGTLKAWQAMQSFGFIRCDAVDREWGKDVFVHRRDLAPGQHIDQADVGKRVSFTLSINNKGQPQAEALRIIS